MIVSNIFLPLVGLVDTAIVGHLPGTHFLAGVSLGSLVITQLVWVCGFLRMSVTGLSAQTSTDDKKAASFAVLLNGIMVAGVLGVVIWGISPWLFDLGVYFSGSNNEVVAVASEYFFIRVAVAPVSLINLVLIGWLLGKQKHRQVMWLQLLANLVNIGLSLGLAIGLQMQVAGVAVATAVAECLLLLLSLSLIAKSYPDWRDWITLQKEAMLQLLSLNRDVFFRNITLQLFLAIFTYLGLQQGELSGATNAVLMQFFVLIALGLDGVAYAAEALFGEADGKRNKQQIRLWVQVSLLISSAFALLYGLAFFLFFYPITQLLTDIQPVLDHIQQFKIYIVLLPLVAHWSFLLDGWYVGMTLAKPMLKTMIMSVVIALIFLSSQLELLSLDRLWQAFLIFLFARGIFLGWHFRYRVYAQRYIEPL